MKLDTPRAYWLVETKSSPDAQWSSTAIAVDGSRNWTASEVVEEFAQRYYDDASVIRVAPITTPKSWDTFDRSVAFNRRDR